jgi:hypothetical protein
MSGGRYLAYCLVHRRDAGSQFFLHPSFGLETGRRRTLGCALERGNIEIEPADRESIPARTGGERVMGGRGPILQLVTSQEIFENLWRLQGSHGQELINGGLGIFLSRFQFCAWEARMIR